MKFTWTSPFRKETPKVKPRKGKIYVSEVDAEHPMMSDKPMYEGHKPSSHLMAREYIPGRGWVTFPTLYEIEGTWYDTRNRSIEEQLQLADEQGESIDWEHDLEGAKNFADKGTWKK